MKQLTSKLVSPYARHRVWRNPFGELSRAERAELAVLDIHRWLEHLKDDRCVLQFFGPCGHGKSTHLIALHSALEDAEYVYLPEDGPHPRIPLGRPLILDEAQRLRMYQWYRILRGRGPLVIGTHVDYAHRFRRRGWRVEHIDLSLPVDAERLAEILNRRLTASAIPNEEAMDAAINVPRISIQLALRLLARFGGDVRSMEHFLYNQFQAHVEGVAEWPPAI